MKYISLIFAAALFCSCSDSFINHSVEYEKLGACSGEQTSIKMLSNINGERYELVSCIDDNFDGKNYQVVRQGDSIIVSFSKSSASKASYKITLDIDAKPAYNHIILDGKDIPIAHIE